MTFERPIIEVATPPRGLGDARRPGSVTLGVATAVLALLAVDCADFSRGSAAPDAADAATEAASPGGDAILSFATDVYPILTAACPRCHVPGGQAGDTQLIFTGSAAADLAKLAPFIDTSAPASSRMLAKMSGQGHGGGVVYAAGSTEYETVLRWIQQGALP